VEVVVLTNLIEDLNAAQLDQIQQFWNVPDEIFWIIMICTYGPSYLLHV
jgi:hypothetical protein